MIIGMGSGCRPWLNVSCAPRCPCLVSILILRRRTLSDTRARDTICLIHSRARESGGVVIITEIRNLPV